MSSGLLRNLRLSAPACCLVAISMLSPVLAQESEIAQELIWVTVDGDQLFEVTGVSGFMAKEASARFVGVAEQEDVEAVHWVEDRLFGLWIIFGDVEIIVVINKDATLEDIDSDTLAEVRGQVITEAVRTFRERHSEDSSKQSWQVPAVWAGVFVTFCSVIIVFFHFALHHTDRYIQSWALVVEDKTGKLAETDVLVTCFASRFG